MEFAHSNVKYRKFREYVGGVTYTPVDLAKLYNFPAGLTGSGRTIALIELGGGFVQADYDLYRKQLGFGPSTIKFVSVLGGQNRPTTADSADGEVMLDICVAGILAPEATLVVYMAPNSDEGFVASINQAVADGVDAISISWGSPEQNWSVNAINAMNAALKAAVAAGIVVTAAAGDNGSGDGLRGNHADFPASSPFVLGCGGTTTILQGKNLNETVWNDGSNGGATGGGVSALYPIPAFQNISLVPGGKARGIPDVAGNADPATGWQVVVDGKSLVLGGTSAVAPMWAALAVVLMEGLGRRFVGGIHPLLYKAPAGCFRDITVGNNGTFIAKAGYDCCTGLGVPNGQALLNYLKGSGITPPPPPPLSGLRIVLPQATPAGTYVLQSV